MCKVWLVCMLGLWLALPARVAADWELAGKLAWYGPGYYGRPMANGQVFNPERLTVATWLPLQGTAVYLSSPCGRVRVLVTDKMPIPQNGVLFDASEAVARRVFCRDYRRQGVQEVVIKIARRSYNAYP